MLNENQQYDFLPSQHNCGIIFVFVIIIVVFKYFYNINTGIYLFSTLKNNLLLFYLFLGYGALGMPTAWV